MKKFKKHYITEIIPLLIIFGLWLVILLTNSSSKWLIGWDNVLSELNLQLAFSRAISGVWLTHFGLGTMAGFPVATDLVRLPALLILSLLVPISQVRFLWTLIMLLVGGLGAYSLARLAFSSLKLNRVASIVTGVVYILNLATVQTFYTPFESFTYFFAALPWLLLSSLYWLKNSSKRAFLLLLLIHILAIPAFYVQTFFIVYILILLIFILEILLSHRTTTISKRIFKLLTAIFIVNSFWLVPTSYFTLTKSEMLLAAKGTSLSTPETQLINASYGSIEKIALLQGYWFDYIDERDGSFGYLLTEWRDYVGNDYVIYAGYFVFLVSVLGLILAIFNKKKYRFSWIIFLLFSIMMLTSGVGLLGKGYLALEKWVPLFGQIFRSPFTKWSIPLALAVSLGSGFVLVGLARFLRKWLVSVVFILASALIASSVIITRPIFKGELIAKSMRVDFPEAYKDLFTYFDDKQSDSRIAFLPVQSFWGWNFHSWGYRGSGFLWYGLKQPILDRAFDIWSEHNESFYLEASTAIHGKDAESLENVFEKYDVTYLLVDESVIIPEASRDLLKLPEMYDLLSEIDAQKIWEKDFLKVYKLNSAKSALFTPLNYKEELFDSSYGRSDLAQRRGNYLWNSKTKNLYPFSSLLNESPEVNYKRDIDGGVYAEFHLDLDQDTILTIPPFDGNYLNVTAKAVYDGELIKITFKEPYSIYPSVVESEILPPLFVGVPQTYKKIGISIEKRLAILELDKEVLIDNIDMPLDRPLKVDVFNADKEREINIASDFAKTPISLCWEKEEGIGELNVDETVDETKEGTGIYVKDAVGCVSLKLGSFSAPTLLSIELPYKSTNTRPSFCLVQEGGQECLHDDVYYHSSTSSEFSSVKRNVLIDGGKTYWLVISGRSPDETNKEGYIIYKTPKISALTNTGSFEFTTNIHELLSDQQIYALKAGTTTIRFPLSEITLPLTEWGRLEEFNCDIFKRGLVSKSKLNLGMIYKATNQAASCDFAILKDINSHGEYLMRLQGENIRGRSLKVYINNQSSKRNDLEIMLPEGEFDKTYSLLAWPKLTKKDYVFNLETRSFGPETSENTLDTPLFYPFPLSWVAQWNTGEQASEKENSTQLIETSQYGSAFYIAHVRGSGGILTLSQGYDSGWIAIGKVKLLKHFHFNSWANAWETPEGEYTIYILFWPQLLQWFGYGALITYVFVKSRRFLS